MKPHSLLLILLFDLILKIIGPEQGSPSKTTGKSEIVEIKEDPPHGTHANDEVGGTPNINPNGKRNTLRDFFKDKEKSPEFFDSEIYKEDLEYKNTSKLGHKTFHTGESSTSRNKGIHKVKEVNPHRDVEKNKKFHQLLKEKTFVYFYLSIEKMYNLKLKYNNNDIKGAIHLLKEEKAKLENNLIDVKKIVQKNGGFFRMLTYKTKSVKKINQAEIMLDQFTVYEDLDFETAIMESNEAVDPKKLVDDGLRNVYKFLCVLQSCAIIIKDNEKMSLFKDNDGFNLKGDLLKGYCENNILPNAREVLNYAKLSYKFGKFYIYKDENDRCANILVEGNEYREEYLAYSKSICEKNENGTRDFVNDVIFLLDEKKKREELKATLIKMKEILELKDKKLKKNIKIEEIQTKKKNENEFKEKEQAELLLDQFTKYEGFDLETAISESEKAIDPNTLVAEFKNISKFLSVLQFCATINFKFGKNSNARLLNFYCTHDMLLKAEEILISVNKGYRFGKFSIGNPCDMSEAKKTHFHQVLPEDVFENNNEDFFIQFYQLCKEDATKDFIEKSNIFLKDEKEREELAEILIKWKNYFVNSGKGKKLKSKMVKDEQFENEKYAQLLLQKFNDENEGFDSVIDPEELTDELKEVDKLLFVLHFCATIKRELHENTRSRKILLFYCKYDVLPKAREVLNSAGIGYKFGKFRIKIDSELEEKDSSQIDNWYDEEEYVGKKLLKKISSNKLKWNHRDKHFENVGESWAPEIMNIEE